jgi:hypothetical protein
MENDSVLGEQMLDQKTHDPQMPDKWMRIGPPEIV